MAARKAKPEAKPYKMAEGAGMYLEVMPKRLAEIDKLTKETEELAAKVKDFEPELVRTEDANG